MPSSIPRPRQIDPDHLHQFGLGLGTGHAEYLRSDLVELPETTLLRTFVAKHRAAVPEPLTAVVQQPLLDGGPHAARSALGPQGKLLAAPIEEGVHLLFNDVGRFSDATAEEFRCLQQRQAQLFVPVGANGRDDLVFDPPRAFRIAREEVPHAAHPAKLHGVTLPAPGSRRWPVCAAPVQRPLR